jgi:hypothetical protein
MSDTGSDIIIKGGSVHLTYDGNIYTKDQAADPKTWKNNDKKIIQVIITDDNDEVVYDTGEHLGGLRYTIKARCK